MKAKYSVAIFVTALAIGGFFVWFLSDTSLAKPVFEATPFANEIAVGEAAYNHIQERLKLRKILVVGIPPQPELYEKVVDAFFAKTTQIQNLVVLKEPKWPPLKIDSNLIIDFNFNQDDLSELAQKILEGRDMGQTVVIYTVSIFSSHLIANNAIHRLEKALGEQVTALTLGQLTLRHAGEHLNQPPCIGSMRDTQGLSELGCAQLANSRRSYKKLLPLDKLTASLIEQNEDDYLLQVYFPSKN